MVIVSLTEFKVDVSYFKMIADFHDRKCPCWGGKFNCPCPSLAEAKLCRCGAVRTLDDPKAQKPSFRTHAIDFQKLLKIIQDGYKCPEDEGKICFCKEFLESGKCALNVFKQSDNAH